MKRPDEIEMPTNPPPGNRSLCRYLADESAEAGMRAYLGFAKYRILINNLAWASVVPHFRDRTMTLCFDDFTSSPERASKVIGEALEFLNVTQTQHDVEARLAGLRQIVRPPPAKANSSGAGTGGNKHAAYSHDAELRARLRELVKKIDRDVYGGQIAWLESSRLVPC